jgi:hypothetical protein
VVSSRHSVPIVQALLHYRPFALRSHDKTVQVDLKAVGDGVVINSSGEPAGAYQCVRIETAPLGY